MTLIYDLNTWKWLERYLFGDIPDPIVIDQNSLICNSRSLNYGTMPKTKAIIKPALPILINILPFVCS